MLIFYETIHQRIISGSFVFKQIDIILLRRTQQLSWKTVQMMARVMMWHIGLRLVTVKFVTLSIIKGITQTCYRFLPA